MSDLYKTVYAIFEAECGEFSLDRPGAIPFADWIAERKREYLEQFPERARNQSVDGYFYTMELNRFFEWVAETRRPGPRS